MARFNTSLVIPRPLAAAFAFVTDFRNAPRWDPRTHEARKTTPGPIGLGTRFVLLGGLVPTATLDRLHVPHALRHTSELEYEVVSFVPRREMVVRGETAALRYEDHLMFSDEGGATRLSYLAILEGKGVLDLADRVLQPIFDVIGAAATRGIATAVEAAVPDTRADATPPALPASPIVHPDDVRRVVALDDHAVLRNLLITQGYHDVSEALRARTGGLDMNWCTLGSWASRTAGAFIRDEEVPAVFRKQLETPGALVLALDELQRKLNLGNAAPPASLLEIARAVLHDCSTYITAGNKVVYAELAQCCADFVDTFGRDSVPDPAKLAAFQASYTEGDPLPDALDWAADRTLVGHARGGQALLRGMVGQLYRAMFETCPKQRAEQVLFANALGGLHEQTRLHNYIAGGIDAPVADTLVAWAHKHVDRSAPAVGRGLLHTAVDTMMPALGRLIQDAWRLFSTDVLMTLTLPDGVLHLGKPLPQDAGAPVFPPALATIADRELAALLDRYGALDVPVGHAAFDWLKDRVRSLFDGRPVSPVAFAEVGALDWTCLEQRMRFILTLFRARQQDVHLFQRPFTDDQRAALFEGRIPPGPL